MLRFVHNWVSRVSPVIVMRRGWGPRDNRGLVQTGLARLLEMAWTLGALWDALVLDHALGLQERLFARLWCNHLWLNQRVFLAPALLSLFWLPQLGFDHLVDFLYLDVWLFCQSKQVIEVELAFQIQCKADKGVDEADETLHKLAGLSEASNHPDFRLNKESLPDLL